MNLEGLILNVRAASKAVIDYDWHTDPRGERDTILKGNEKQAEMYLLAFVMLNADTLISWERQHATRTSPLDGDV